MAAYVVVQGTVKDADKMKEYAAGAGPTVVSHGGEVVVRGPSEVLAGSSEHELLVLLKFPSRQAAVDWYNSDEYQALLPTRLAAMDSIFKVVGD
jgi:uncharacterized protein (DUF1330 family)